MQELSLEHSCSLTGQGWPSPPLRRHGCKNRICPHKNSLELFPEYQTALFVLGQLTCQTDITAALGCCVREGTKASAVCTLVDTSVQLPGPPPLSSEALVRLNLLGGSVWHGAICGWWRCPGAIRSRCCQPAGGGIQRSALQGKGWAGVQDMQAGPKGRGEPYR